MLGTYTYTIYRFMYIVILDTISMYIMCYICIRSTVRPLKPFIWVYGRHFTQLIASSELPCGAESYIHIYYLEPLNHIIFHDSTSKWKKCNGRWWWVLKCTVKLFRWLNLEPRKGPRYPAGWSHFQWGGRFTRSVVIMPHDNFDSKYC